jgi:magnesium-transporting ATPase (P-type)
MFSATDLKVDNSSLTGESEPQERRGLPNGSQSRPVEAENLVFNSTLIVNGEGWGVVVRTGDHTLIGQIAALTGGESGNKSPLGVEMYAGSNTASIDPFLTALRLQRPIRRRGFLHRYRLRYRVLCGRYHHRIQG